MKSNHFWSVRWILTTLLAIAGVAVLARLGIWQLDRLAERRVFNERVLSQLHASPLDLNQVWAAARVFATPLRVTVPVRVGRPRAS